MDEPVDEMTGADERPTKSRRGQSEGSRRALDAAVAKRVADAEARREKAAPVVPKAPERKPSRMLSQMQKVFNQTKDKDVGEGQGNFRKSLEEDRGKYIAQMVSLERSYLSTETKEQAQGALVAGTDKGTEKVLALIDKLLAECREKAGLPPMP